MNEIEKRVEECISQIKKKGFYIIKEEPDEKTFEFIYKVQKSGEYFLDLTPARNESQKQWVLRDDPKDIVSKNVIKTNNLQRKILWVTCGLSLAAVFISWLDYNQDNNPKLYLMPSTNQLMPLEPTKNIETSPKKITVSDSSTPVLSKSDSVGIKR